MKKEEKIINELNKIKFWIIMGMGVILIAMALSVETNINKEIIINDVEIIEILEIIEENCGSTHIVNHNGKWEIFSNHCKEDNYCKYGYTKLEDCLK